MSQRGISFRLNSHVTAFAILIISAIVFLNYHYSTKILVEKIEEGAINQSNLVISKISRITVGTEEIAKNVSYQALYYFQHNDLEVFLNQVLTSNTILESINVEFTEDQPLTFTACNSTGRCSNRCNSDNTIFSDSSPLEQGTWSKPFYCMNDTTHLLVTYRVPVFHPESKKIVGLVYCEISLRKMKEMLSKIKIGEKGYAFLINQEGNFITHPNENWILSKNIYKNPPVNFYSDLTEIELKIKRGMTVTGHGISEYLNFQKAWYYFAPLPNSIWSVIIVIPDKELFQKMDIIFKEIIFISGLGILLLFIMNMLIFKRILTPLAEITTAIHRFSNSSGEENKSKDEIKLLENSLENWQTKYGNLIKQQTHTAKEKLKFTKDLKSAREIQMSIIPSGKPIFNDHPEIDLSAILLPAETVGGDLYDYFFIDRHHLLVAIGDVSGKGISASLFMAIASTLIKTNSKIISAKDLVSKVNSELSERNSHQNFITLFIGILDVRSGILDYCNAAHNFPYILHADGSIHAFSKSHGLPLGIYKDKTYKNSKIDMKHGDVLLLYTDGVINAMDLNKQHYGLERLENNLKNMIDVSAEEIVTKLVKSLSIYEGGNSQADDISILAVKYLPETKRQI